MILHVLYLLAAMIWAANAGVDAVRLADGERYLASLAFSILMTLASGALVLA